MSEKTQDLNLISMVAQIVASYASNHLMNPSEMPAFIRLVHQNLTGLSSRKFYYLPTKCIPAVPIEESISPDYIICLEDGRQLKMLKRHLKTAYNMTPEQYRERWNLPINYPMVAPNYTKRRSHIAKSIGLGTLFKRAKKELRVKITA